MNPSRPLFGFALVELLVAMVLLGLGTASLLRLHLDLQLGNEQSRQRSEATRWAAQDLEQLRWHTRDGGQGTLRWADIADAGPTVIEAASSPTRYTLRRSVAREPRDLLRSVTTTVTWADRQAGEHTLTLATALSAIDPTQGAATVLARDPPRSGGSGGTTGSGAAGRSLRIPAAAKNLGDGRHAFKPRVDETLVWLFDSVTGDVNGRCDSRVGVDNTQIDATSLGNCKTLTGLLLSGHVRFATNSDTLTATDAEQPASPAMSLNLRLTLTTLNHPAPAWECVQDGPLDTPPATTTRTSIAWYCVIQPVAPAAGGTPRWSGRLDLVPSGWSLVTSTSGTAGRYRVCRYSADLDGNGRIDNAEHPASYSVVTTGLSNQNFLVIRAAARCPVDSGTGTAAAGAIPTPINDSTVAHQP